MLLLYGDEDAAVPPEVQQDLYQQLQRWNVEATVKVYQGAGHVFAGKHFGDAYREQADRDSWALAVEFAGQATRAQP